MKKAIFPLILLSLISICADDSLYEMDNDIADLFHFANKYPGTFLAEHLVDKELEETLDEHGLELLEQHSKCKLNKYCLQTKGGVVAYSWLEDYLVKYDIQRVVGVYVLDYVIKKYDLDSLCVPKKYYYHLKGKPQELSNSNYLVIAQKLECTLDHALNLKEAQQLVTLIKLTGVRDLKIMNICSLGGTKLAIIDTGKESFPTLLPHTKPLRADKVFDSILRLIDQTGFFMKRRLITQEAYEYIVDTLIEFIKTQPEPESYYQMMTTFNQQLDELPKPWPWDYKKALEKMPTQS